MPYAHRKKKIPRELDRRVKYTEEDKEKVKTMYRFERLSQRAISRDTGISRRMVSFILFPEKYEVARKQFKERRKDGRYFYGKKWWRETMKEHRRYKQGIKEKLI